ncbi:hypothetical protein WUBG_17650, partial [Wuchereria bancrofti]
QCQKLFIGRVRSSEACVLRRVRSHCYYKRSVEGGSCNQCWSCSQQRRCLAHTHIRTRTHTRGTLTRSYKRTHTYTHVYTRPRAHCRSIRANTRIRID